jgi:hypothetical protein
MKHLPGKGQSDESCNAGVEDDRPNSEFARTHAEANVSRAAIHPESRQLFLIPTLFLSRNDLNRSRRQSCLKKVTVTKRASSQTNLACSAATLVISC